MEVHFILKIFKKHKTKGSLISKIKNENKNKKIKELHHTGSNPCWPLIEKTSGYQLAY
jgi:hypothetical protein